MYENICLEEHIVSREIESVNNETINSAYPYYKAFQNPAAAAAYGLSFKDLFQLGERRIKDLDEAGIDMEIISYTNVTQWLTQSRHDVSVITNIIKIYSSKYKEDVG